jgi:hypothetical protein
MYAAYVACHSKAVVHLAKSRETIVHSVEFSLTACDWGYAYTRFYIAFFLLVWGECTHIFHMHCLLKWIGTSASKQQCPMDRRPWGELCSCVAVDFALMLVPHQLRPKDAYEGYSYPNASLRVVIVQITFHFDALRALIRTEALYDIHYPCIINLYNTAQMRQKRFYCLQGSFVNQTERNMSIKKHKSKIGRRITRNTLR